MTKLEKLYCTIQNLKELGLELGEEMLKQTNELEQEVIKKRDTSGYKREDRTYNRSDSAVASFGGELRAERAADCTFVTYTQLFGRNGND